MSPEEIQTLSVDEAKPLFEDNLAIFIDVRDPHSFRAGHIPGAKHVNDHNLDAFLENADKSKAYIVYCYHGYSSQGGTAYFLENGFQDVKSLDGGFSAWQQKFPMLTQAKIESADSQ
ncbi:thiosulfate sulfurtransferase GlpE [bacterium (Candidatus Blackallbacteria) CG17_big_fil_post_rev_8_21_14_2_50_48_46]|uniref:Thiosulfate sulfurtransferase GlpE n=1 Tax=bacterium (Candidatus Blackallbacteria) CG17_big_fil_post_rev_8_21_14_2_50_48_46 TaxID=2014261 RepID=A0A2M7FZD3_9BACT|nr:MAG: thiosulfate sulfurtransferase GlpE [bacterium (Candidatus Blackallbacteria) CG18_big_fil_WC_8_21_14_2_50_49_26]PIW14757.1 MAG: thiosulfate sulfurtransferase GlpE [bacterium (Candidatus Blackallbacteria) CG17_big_fil_post_rev_8_21_14_2_50_48_46]PIW50859.1 MAG: thiosulfate sulfurtransferase GlpE [bacterium (Candidatus Blackallbacteria) CG13_big_fil_rev_8_21_14_2_50_49_14]